ncbi:MAG: hypothetical protein JG771_890, partial [Methermicoccus sp.]|nr:hypothetical protein [Methermicoccus sp.]
MGISNYELRITNYELQITNYELPILSFVGLFLSAQIFVW